MLEKNVTRREFIRDTAAAAVGVAAGLAATRVVGAGNPTAADTSKILNYSPDMEYRRCGRTGMMVSAIALGGHWKRLDKIIGGTEPPGWMTMDVDRPKFQKNRYDVLTRCIERGINYVDACCGEEILAYSRALKGRRDKMYFGFSWHVRESRFTEWTSAEKLQEGLDLGLKEAGLEYVDLWRITLLEKSSKHTNEEIEEAVKALEAAKKAGKACFTGFSSHDRPHIKWMIETFPKQIEVVVTPYTAKSKELPQDSLFEAVAKQDVGIFGIKPFASGSLFKAGGAPDGPDAEEDSTRARMAIRYILCNLAVTAPIPELITAKQVTNVAQAMKERRELDKKEQGHLQRAMDEAWAKLPDDYQWLKQWEWV